MKNCMNCSHAVFDKVWGEYKCTLKQHRIHEPEKEDCKDHLPLPAKAQVRLSRKIHTPL